MKVSPPCLLIGLLFCIGLDQHVGASKLLSQVWPLLDEVPLGAPCIFAITGTLTGIIFRSQFAPHSLPSWPDQRGRQRTAARSQFRGSHRGFGFALFVLNLLVALSYSIGVIWGEGFIDTMVDEETGSYLVKTHGQELQAALEPCHPTKRNVIMKRSYIEELSPESDTMDLPGTRVVFSVELFNMGNKPVHRKYRILLTCHRTLSTKGADLHV